MDHQIKEQFSRVLGILKFVRHKREFSQEYIRESIGVDVSRIETGEHYPGMKNFLQLCDGFKVCPGWLWILSGYVQTGDLSQKEMEEIILHWDSYKDSAKSLTDCFITMLMKNEKSAKL